MLVKVISKEFIRPSNPTPPNLRNFKICLLDQFVPSFYVPLILFYPSNLHENQNLSTTVSHLKNSMSKTLSRFYPLAGRMKDCSIVDCYDFGVPFIVAHVSCRLDELLKDPLTDSMSDFVPFKTNCFQPSTNGLVGIQVTTFDCGGMVIGVCIHHQAADATSMVNFIKSWADETTIDLHMPKGDHMENPDLTIARELFPPVDSPQETQKTMKSLAFEETKFVQRRYVFDKGAIATLQTKASNEAIPKPTRNEAVSSFIWKHMMEASRTITSSSFTSIAYITVNLRPRFKSPLSKNCFGNLFWFEAGSFYLPSDGETEPELSHLAHEVKQVVAGFDTDFVAKLQQPGVVPEIIQGIASSISEDIKMLKFTNWCNLGHYNIDFGWGRPVWIAYAHKNDLLNHRFNILMDSPSGIEIWVIADETTLSVMEKSPDFLEYASINPSVIS